jgi:ADP-ribose pyrophosphatase
VKNPRLLGDTILVEKYGKRYISRKYNISGKIFDFHCLDCLNGIISVIIFALTENNEVIVEKQFRFGANRMFFELPGGNKGKLTSIACAKKELEEETGFVAGKVHIFKKVWLDPAAMTIPFIPSIATNCKNIGKTHLDKTEVIETVLIPLKKWLEMIHSGKINDSKTITTTFLSLKHLGLI